MTAFPVAAVSRTRRTLPGLLVFLLALAVLCPARATTVTPPSFSHLINEAQTIVRARVVGIRCEWADSPQGRVIKTHVTFSVQKRIKGDAAPEITLRFLGGEIGSEGMRVSGMPSFEVGQQEFLFISGNGIRFCPLVAMMHGRYRILTDPTSSLEYVARNDHVPLSSEHDVQLPQSGNPLEFRFKPASSALTPLAFEQRITSEITRRVTQP